MDKNSRKFIGCDLPVNLTRPWDKVVQTQQMSSSQLKLANIETSLNF